MCLLRFPREDCIFLGRGTHGSISPRQEAHSGMPRRPCHGLQRFSIGYVKSRFRWPERPRLPDDTYDAHSSCFVPMALNELDVPVGRLSSNAVARKMSREG
jgi:hypothetical protein